jgi:mannose-6-phosphate isomerase
MNVPPPLIEKRPWGEFHQYTKGEPVTVKILFIHHGHGETLSLQYHNHRSEFWKILKGHPLVEIGDQAIEAKEGDEFFIDIGVQHRMSAPHDEVEFLEIARGEFDENDIVRLEDKYGRAQAS